ncbi:unnamed protein product [Boreogadus saida]
MIKKAPPLSSAPDDGKAGRRLALRPSAGPSAHEAAASYKLTAVLNKEALLTTAAAHRGREETERDRLQEPGPALVQGSWCRAPGAGLLVQGSWCRAPGAGLLVQGSCRAPAGLLSGSCRPPPPP